MQLKIQKVRELRKCTNNRARLSECLEALNKAEGDFERAKTFLNDLGLIERPKIPFYSFIFSIPKDAPSAWRYILAKANRYLRLGPDTYRKADYFGMPDAECDEETLREIESCFRQFLNYKGYLEANPIENVSISGFYAAMRTLHFEEEQRASFHSDLGVVLDSMLFEHVVDKRSIRLFNKVVYNTEMLTVIQPELLTPASGYFQEVI